MRQRFYLRGDHAGQDAVTWRVQWGPILVCRMPERACERLFLGVARRSLLFTGILPLWGNIGDWSRMPPWGNFLSVVQSY